MPLSILALLTLAAIALYLARQNGDAPSVAAFDGGDAPSIASEALDAGGELLDAGGALLESFGVTIRNAFTLPASAAMYSDAIAEASAAQGLPDGLLARVLYQESAFRPDVITGNTKSTAGALGIAQFMPATAADLGIDPLDPRQAIPAAAKYLRSLFDQLGSWPAALAGYNWGPGNVARKGVLAAPPETQKYVASIVADVPSLST
jgi:soluble lytic murein transglycosylase-like protein